MDGARREARNIYNQIVSGRFRSLLPAAAEPFNPEETKNRCREITGT
jgi:hypothetical protein